jgi:hypothetical protein
MPSSHLSWSFPPATHGGPRLRWVAGEESMEPMRGKSASIQCKRNPIPQCGRRTIANTGVQERRSAWAVPISNGGIHEKDRVPRRYLFSIRIAKRRRRPHHQCISTGSGNAFGFLCGVMLLMGLCEVVCCCFFHFKKHSSHK